VFRTKIDYLKHLGKISVVEGTMPRGLRVDIDRTTLETLRSAHKSLGGIAMLLYRINSYLKTSGRGDDFGISLSNGKNAEYLSEGKLTEVLGLSKPIDFVPSASLKYKLALEAFAASWPETRPEGVADSPIGKCESDEVTSKLGIEEHNGAEGSAFTMLCVRPQKKSESDIEIDGVVFPIVYELSSNTQEKVPMGGPMEIFFDAEFNPFNFDSKVKFGFKTLRLEVTVPEQPDIYIKKVIGLNESVRIGGAEIRSTGPASRTTWQIMLACAFETCRIATTDQSLFAVQGLAAGTVIGSKIYVRREDSVLEINPEQAAAHNTNARALMDFLCTQQAIGRTPLGDHCIISRATSCVVVEGA
jgi:hypothetical protein